MDDLQPTHPSRPSAAAPPWPRRLLACSLVATTAAAAIASGSPVVAQLTVLLLAALAVSIVWGRWGALGLRGSIHPERSRLTAGDDLVADVRVRNLLPLPRPRVDLALGGEAGGRRRWSTPLSPGGSHDFTIRLRFRRRGVYELGPLEITSPDPLELFATRRPSGSARQIVVVPPAPDLPFFRLPGGARGDGRARGRADGAPIASGVRPYVSGDPVRRVHWPLSLRKGELLVKTMERDPESPVWLALDLCAADQADDPDPLERGIVAVAAIARHGLSRGRAVGFLAHGHEATILPPARGRQQLELILDALARARPEGRLPLAQLLAERLRRAGHGSALIAVSCSPAVGLRTAARVIGVPAAQLVLVRLGSDDTVRQQRGPAALAQAAEYTLHPAMPLAEALASPRGSR